MAARPGYRVVAQRKRTWFGTTGVQVRVLLTRRGAFIGLCSAQLRLEKPTTLQGDLAQLAERLFEAQRVTGSIPVVTTAWSLRGHSEVVSDTNDES